MTQSQYSLSHVALVHLLISLTYLLNFLSRKYSSEEPILYLICGLRNAVTIGGKKRYRRFNRIELQVMTKSKRYECKSNDLLKNCFMKEVFIVASIINVYAILCRLILPPQFSFWHKALLPRNMNRERSPGN